jgi:hypothetical protein
MKPIFDQHIPRQTKLTESEAAETLQVIIPLFERIQAVVDGLDELLDDEKVKFLALLKHLPIQVLIFSRPMVGYMELLPNIDALFVEAKDQDIELFTRDRMRNTPTLQSLVRGKDALRDQITNTVKDRSRGM